MRDNEIIDLYWKRDEAAVAATADTYGKYCYSIAFQILQSNEDAEECVNDTCWKAWSSIPPHRPERLSTFLGKITRNLALDRWKQSNTQKRGMGQIVLALEELEPCIPTGEDIEQIVDEMVLAKAIERFLYQYPKTERRIFVGRYWYLYSICEIATAYRMRESKVTSLLYRMRKNLKLFLEKEDIFNEK